MHPILADNYFWLPKQASTVARSTDNLFNFVLWVSVFFFLLITVLLVYFVIKYRHKPGEKRDVSASHSMTLELTWTIIPSILCVFLYYYGFKEYMNLAVEPPNAYEVTVTGKMWQWTFDYPNGAQSNELHCVVNQPVRCVLQSNDVIHSLFVPAFRVKKDVVPGRYNRLWFQATEAGTFDIFCAAYCGTNHSTMYSHVVVHPSQADFDAWMKIANNDDALPLVDRGKKYYMTQGCAQCHSTDGSRITGPSWRNLFGSTQQFTDGSTAVVDDAFVHEFVLNPTRRVPVGYPPVMPVIPLKAGQVDGIVAYMKTISENYHASAPPTTQATTGPTTQPVQ
jgi:cytochrome c oxidase subunit 2